MRPIQCRKLVESGAWFVWEYFRRANSCDLMEISESRSYILYPANSVRHDSRPLLFIFVFPSVWWFQQISRGPARSVSLLLRIYSIQPSWRTWPQFTPCWARNDRSCCHRNLTYSSYSLRCLGVATKFTCVSIFNCVFSNQR